MKLTRIVLPLISVALVYSYSAKARPWYVEPGVALSAGYDDNPTLRSDAVADLVDDVGQIDLIEDESFALVSGDIRLGSDSESDLIAFDFAAIARRYNDSDLNSEYLRTTALYQKNGEKQDYEIEVGFSRDTTLETELEDTGLLEFNVDRDQRFIRSSLVSRFTQSLIGEFDLGYRDVSFDGGTDDFTDFEDLAGSAKLDRIISERMSLFGLAEFLRYQPTGTVGPGEIERDDFSSLQLGINYNLTQQLALSISAGRGFIDTELSNNTDAGADGTSSFSENSTIYSVGLGYEGQRNSIDAVFSSTFDSSADGGLSETERLTIALTRPETLGGTLNLQAAYVNRDPVRGETESRDYYVINPNIVWQINQNLSLLAEVQYREQELTDTTTNVSEQADSSSAIVGLRYDFGRKRISY